MTSVSNKLRQYVRKHDIRIAKEIYRNIAVPMYRLASIPVYDITASFRHGYTWFRIPKNATHSIMRILTKATPPDINSSYIPYFERTHLNNFRFCFIRNPWDRLVSVYANKIEMQLMFRACWGRDFAYFIEFVSRQDLRRCDPHLRLQTALFPVEDVDFVGRMENFERDMRYVMQTLGIDGIITTEGRVEHAVYSEYYDDRLRDMVGTVYADDVRYGRYTF